MSQAQVGFGAKVGKPEGNGTILNLYR